MEGVWVFLIAHTRHIPQRSIPPEGHPFMAFQHRPPTGSPPPIPTDLQNLRARRHRIASETPKLLLFVTTMLAVAGLRWMGLSLRSFHLIIYFKTIYRRSPSGQGCPHFSPFCCHQHPPCGLVNIISSKEKSRQFWEMFLVLFFFSFFFTHAYSFRKNWASRIEREGSIYTSNVSRTHTMLNTFGAVPIKSCVYEEKQEGSVFYCLSLDAKVWGCGCNWRPSGLSGRARPLGMEALRGELVRWESQNGWDTKWTISFAFPVMKVYSTRLAGSGSVSRMICLP